MSADNELSEPSKPNVTRRAPTADGGVFMLPRQKSRSRDRRESRMFLVDGQLFWSDDTMGMMSGAKRHSSATSFAIGSSMDLSGIGQSLDSSGGAGSGSEELISYRLKWCRESIAQLKRQTWPMDRKLKTLRACKMFIKQHQGELKQSKQAKDVLASTNAMLDRYWRHFKREFANFLVIITPWEMRIKKIESHFGSVVASYFTFLRWIFWLNLANSLVLCSFVLVPELIENEPDVTGMRKGELGMVRPKDSQGKTIEPEFNPKLFDILEFDGFLRYTPIFYGYYSNIEISRSGFWRNPLAYLLSMMLTYLFCFFCISRKLSQNNKLSRPGSKDDEYTFCWTVFVGWDFMIGNSETAYNKTSSLVMNLKEGILEEKEQTKNRDWRLLLRRILANLISIALIVSSAYVVSIAVQRSENLPEDASLLKRHELQLVMFGIQFMFPPLFDIIGLMEVYHPRKALNWQLGRILAVNFLDFYALMFNLFGTVAKMSIELNEVAGNMTLWRQNQTYYRNLFTTTTTTTTTTSTTTTTTTLAPQTSTISMILNQTDIMSIMDPNSTILAITATTLLTNATSSYIELDKSILGFNGSTNSTLAIDKTATNLNGLNMSTTKTQSSTPPSLLTLTSQLPESTSQNTLKPIDTVASTPKMAEPSSGSSDYDYPDLGELMQASQKVTQRPRLAKRSPQTRTKTLEDDGIYSSRVFNGAFIPPIRDPYRKTTSKPANGQYSDAYGTPRDEEEPLEGRLGLESRPTSTRRPAQGIARPIGGGSPVIRRKNPRPIQVETVDESPDYDYDQPTIGDQQASMSPNSNSQTPTPTTSTESQIAGTTILPAISGFSTGLPLPLPSDITTQKPNQQLELTPTSGFDLVKPKTDVALDNSSMATGVVVGSNCRLGANVFDSLHNGSKANDTDKRHKKSAEDTDCANIPDLRNEEILALNETLREKLKSLCWETFFGQEMVKMVVSDMVFTVVTTIAFEFFRACFVRYCNRFFFWDLERKLPGYQDFKLAENVLHLVNNQSTVWMGMFFAPGLPAINTIKLAVIMYIRSWAVLTCNIPHETVFKVSKSNNFYYLILLLNLIICIMPVAYAITWIRPSWHCGPFGGECRMYLAPIKLIKSMLPPGVNAILHYLTSPGTVIPIIVLLVLIIYYLSSTLSSSKEANKELKAQLKKDKEQEGTVPEITSTSVVDPAPSQPAQPVGLQAALSAAAPANAAAANPNLGPNVTANENSRAGLSLASTVNQLASVSETTTRPKSLLLPPPNPL